MVRAPTWMMRKRVPLAERLVGQDERVLAGVARAVVPEPARALVGAHLGVARLGEVPDLDLRRAAEIDAAVGLGADLVVDEQLDVAVVLVGGQVGALAVVDELAVLDAPVLLGVLGVAWRAAWPSPRRSWPRTCAGRSVSWPCQPDRSLPLNRVTKPPADSSALVGRRRPGPARSRSEEQCMRAMKDRWRLMVGIPRGSRAG